ncbi:hypothetical protein LBMAG49_26800 [Planctomycetota bacterium]|nr:terpene cyclase/mutase family protein [Planctomycetota bacterium]GDY03351.1 hypothetical protein LBMAG49_26800 [Planctomycetota bacterium]
MNDPAEPSVKESLHTEETLGSKAVKGTPWALISIMIHVVGIAIAALWVLTKEYETKEDTDTAMRVAAPIEQIEEIKPPEIVDREQLPKLEDQDIQPSDLTEFNQEAEDNPENGDPTNQESDLTNLPAGDTTGGTAIGMNGPGHFGIAPSSVGGKNLGGGKYGSRFGNGKGPGGAGGQTNKAIVAGLEWLRKHQDEDGHWDTANFMKHDEGAPCDGPGNSGHDVGITGLALLAFLGNGNTLKLGPYRKVVRQGVKWLQEQQREDGLIGMPSTQTYLYSHAIATLAVCESYGLSDNYRPLKSVAQKALNYIAQARNTYGVWRYQPKDNDNDTSISGWMIQALLSGKEFKLAVDDSAFSAAKLWFDSVTDPVTGSSGYQKRGEGSSRPVELVDKFPAAKTESLTAVVLLCRCLMHESPKESPTMDKATDTIMKKTPIWNTTDGSIDMYYWYYGSYAMFQMGGKHWDSWSKKMTDAVLKTQRGQSDGNFHGSWDAADPWGQDGGRIYSTAIMVLCLEAYFRYGRVLGAR